MSDSLVVLSFDAAGIAMSTEELRPATRKAAEARFTLAEQDGSPICEGRRLHIQVAVITAIESLAWSPRAAHRPSN